MSAKISHVRNHSKDSTSFYNKKQPLLVAEQQYPSTSATTQRVVAELQQPAAQNNFMKGVFFMNLFALCNTAVLALFKSCKEQGVSVTQFTFIRSLGNCIITSLLIACQSSASFSVPAGKRKLLAVRSFFGMAGSVLGVASLIFIPISLQTIIFQTNPFWSSIIAYLFLREAIQRLDLVSMVICFAGVLIIATSSPSSEDADNTSSGMQSIIGCVLAFMLAWSFASMGALNRKLHDLHCMTIMFYHTLTAASVMLIVILCNSIATGEMPEIYSNTLYCWICLSCVLDSISMNSMTFAFQSASPAFVSLIGQLSIVYAFIADALIFNQTPSSTELLGASIILIVTFMVGLIKIISESRNQPIAKKGFEVDYVEDEYQKYVRDEFVKSMAQEDDHYQHHQRALSQPSSSLNDSLQHSTTAEPTSSTYGDDDHFKRRDDFKASSFTKISVA